MIRRLGWLLAALGCGVDDDRELGLRLTFEPIAVDGAIGSVTDFRFIPGTDDLLVLDKGGTITHLQLEGDRARIVGAVTVPGVYSALDCGLISLALDPDFADNHHVYVGACLDLTQSAILRLTVELDDLSAAAETVVEIFRAGDVLADRPWHNVGAMGFEPGGVLWALVGDKTVRANGQSTDDALGAVIRIVPSRDPERGGPDPAPDNPWIAARDRDPDVAAIGLRSPWRGAMDARGRLWLGDVGAEAFEEIDVLDGLGANFGWALHEGPCRGGPAECAAFTDPVVHWPHDGAFDYLVDDPEVTTSVSRAAWVGIEHRAQADDPYDGQLAGRMLFGDLCLGFVRALALDDDGTVVDDTALGHLVGVSAWDQGRDGFLYASTFGGCETSEATDASPPRGGLWRAVASGRAN